VVWRVGKPEYEIDVEKRIGYVVAGSPAESAGLKVHDEILNINGKHVRGFRGLVDSVTWHVVSSDSDTVNFLVKRPGVAEPLSIPVKAQKPKEDTSKPTSWWRSIFVRPAFRQAGISSIQTLKITKFMDDSPNNPAEEAGLKKDDILRRVAGVEMTNVATLSDVLEKQVGKPIPVEVERNGELKTFTVTPRLPDQRPSDFKIEDSSLATFGISEWDISGKRLPSHPSPLSQIKDAARTIVETLRAITSPKSDVGPSHLSGFIGIANVYYNLLQDPQGWQRVLWFSVVLNVNLAILNMLPFPVLDGGHITMAIMEWIRRKPINIRLLEVVQTACVLLLLGFMVFISFKDTGDVFGIGRRAEETPKEKVVPKFFPPDKRTVAP
jgi:regulator of sigma E protease